ncbi:MAG: hypothetical protein KJ041_08690 [Gammaproteobacteria bacterium]|nr:hypothetical protein [Gammaproteobacteria bacterium]
MVISIVNFRVSLAACALALAATTATAGGPPPNESYEESCLACHGADLKGIQGLGVALAGSPFVAGLTVPALVEFLKVGRTPNDPASISGRPMPGFSWLDAAVLQEIATYVKGAAGD